MEQRWSVILRRCGLVVVCIAILCGQAALFGWGRPVGCSTEDLRVQTVLASVGGEAGAVLVCAPGPETPVQAEGQEAEALPSETAVQKGGAAGGGAENQGAAQHNSENAPQNTAAGKTQGKENGSGNQSAGGEDTAPASTDKVVYLTFDDGPSSTTEKVLEVLKRENVPATFFVIAAENNEKYLSLIAREVSEGHVIGLHSCTHNYKTIYSSPDAFWRDIAALREKIAPYGGADSMILRFPGGTSNTVSHRYGGSDIMERLTAQAAEQGYTVANWNVSAEDAVGGDSSVSTIYNNVVRDAGEHDECVVLMHDTAATKNSAIALPDIIAWFKAAGYRFDTLDHMKP